MTLANEVRLRFDMRIVSAQAYVESKGYMLSLSETGCHVMAEFSLPQGIAP